MCVCAPHKMIFQLSANIASSCALVLSLALRINKALGKQKYTRNCCCCEQSSCRSAQSFVIIVALMLSCMSWRKSFIVVYISPRGRKACESSPAQAGRHYANAALSHSCSGHVSFTPALTLSLLAIALQPVSDRTFTTSIILFVTRACTFSIIEVVTQLSMCFNSCTNYFTFLNSFFIKCFSFF